MIGGMKIALVQTNPVIGDFSGNTANICSWANKAKAAGCGLIILPEMAVSGYPPQDLLNRPSFVSDQERHVNVLRQKISGITVLCGLVTRNKDSAMGKPLHNSAILFNDREYHLLHKQLLPTYDIFDERRYFEPGHPSSTISWQGLRLGITICEDIFNFGGIGGWPGGHHILPCDASRGYEVDPVAEFLRDPNERPDILVNIAASPFSLGKFTARLHFFQELCRQTTLPLIYVNQVGGQDSVLFDGQSLALDAGGRLRAKAASFREDMLIVDSETLADSSTNNVISQLKEEDASAAAFAALVMGTRDYARKCGFKSAVLGLSGGIDSALTATIASRALGPENVLGVALPSPFTAAESICDARQLALNLGIGFEVISIDALYEAELALLAPLFANLGRDTTEQNIQSRIRGNLLMALANKFGHLLLSTGNKSELSVGYCTLYGDMSGGLAVISDVPKLLVYGICRYLNATDEVIPERTISRPPTAELAPGQRDDDDLPPYDILDPILAAYLEDNKAPAEIVAMGFDKDVVADVVHRLTINEHKRTQAPMGLRISSKAFGSGRRYPTAHGYREDA